MPQTPGADPAQEQRMHSMTMFIISTAQSMHQGRAGETYNMYTLCLQNAFHTHAYVYIYIYPPAPACQGPPGCEASSVQSLISYPTFFQYSISSWSIFISFSMINQQLINQLLNNLLFAGLQVSKLVISTVLLYPLVVHQFTTHQVCCLNLGWSRKSMKFQSISNTPKNHQTGFPRPPEVSQMRSELMPKIIKFTKKSKKW